MRIKGIIRSISFVLILIVCLGVVFCPQATADEGETQNYPAKYDVNRDGTLNIGDVTELLNILADFSAPDIRYDLDGDTSVTIADVSALLNALSGKETASFSAAREVTDRISSLKQAGGFSDQDVIAVLAARNAYDALADAEKEQVGNYALLEAAEKKMLTVKSFTSSESLYDFDAGLYGGNSLEKADFGFVQSIGGKNDGYAWYSSEFRDFSGNVTTDDSNGDGYMNDAGGFIGTKIVPENRKNAYMALLDAGFQTIRLNIYYTTNAGSLNFFCRAAYDFAFIWFGAKPVAEWATLEIPLTMLIENFDAISDGSWFLLGNDVNTVTTLTTVYISDVMIEPIGTVSADIPVERMIASLNQEGALTGTDVQAIMAARAAYALLDENGKVSVDNLALLERAEAKMLSVKSFSSSDSITDFDAGLYGGNSGAKADIGFVQNIGGKSDGYAWFSSRYRNSPGNITSDDSNGDGYMNDAGYFGTKIVPENERSAYQTLLSAGYTTVQFSIYQTSFSGSLAFFCRAAYEDAFVWFGVRGVGEWITLEIPLSIVVDHYDVLSDGTWFLFGGDINTASTLTTVYISDVTVGREEAEADAFAAGALKKYDQKHIFTSEESERGLTLYAASNEYESGQIIIRANSETIRDYNVYCSDFVGPGGRTISRDCVSFYSAYYNQITNSQNGYPDGSVPDILIPLRDRVRYGDNVVYPGENQSIWFTVYVPKAAAAGEYTAEFTAVLNGNPHTVAVKLIVYGFELPDETHVRSAFAVWGPTYGNDMLTNLYGSYANAAETAYYEFLLKYRIAPTGLPDIDLSAARAWVVQAVEYAARADVPCFSLPFKYAASTNYSDGWFDTQFMHDVLSLLVDYSTEELNVFDKLYAYGVVDEPDYTGQYGKARDFNDTMRSIINTVLNEKDAAGAFVEKPSVREGLKNLYTLITVGSWGRDLGDLGNNVSGYCLKYYLFDKSSNRTRISLYQLLGKHIWAYGCNVPGAPYPTYQIDADLTLARAVGVMQMRYGIEGNLFWCANVSKVFNGSAYTTNWDPYETAYAFASWPGDGYLVVPAEKYDPSSLTPYSTIRLETIRDGQEDYEYLYLLKKLANDQGVSSQIDQVLSEEYSKVLDGAKPTTDPEIMYAFKAKIAELILNII